MNFIESLHNRNMIEILQNIFLHLDFQSLHTARRVCRSWNQIILDNLWNSTSGKAKLQRKLFNLWRNGDFISESKDFSEEYSFDTGTFASDENIVVIGGKHRPASAHGHDDNGNDNGAKVIDLATKKVIHHLDHSNQQIYELVENEPVKKCVITTSYIITLTPAIIHIWDKTTFKLRRQINFEHLISDECYLPDYSQSKVLKASEINDVLIISTEATKMMRYTDIDYLLFFKVNMNEEDEIGELILDKNYKIYDDYEKADIDQQYVFVKDRKHGSLYDFTSVEQFWTKVDFKLPALISWNRGCKFTVDYYLHRNTHDHDHDLLEIYDTFSGELLSCVDVGGYISISMDNVIVKNKMVFLTKVGRGHVEVFLIDIGSDRLRKVKSIDRNSSFGFYDRKYIQMNNYSLIFDEASVITNMLLC